MFKDMFTSADQGANNVHQDNFDKLVFHDVLSQSPKLKDSMRKGEKLLKTFPSLAEDIFSAMYKIQPSLTRDVPRGTELNRRELENMFDSQQYMDLRDYSAMDEYNSALACSTVLQEVVTKFEEDEDMKKMAEQQNQMDKGDDPNKSDEENEQDRQEQQQQMQQMMDKNSSKLRRAIGSGMAKAQKEAEDNDEVANALGWSEDGGEFQKLPIKEKDRLFEQAKRMSKMADIVGKMKNIARRTRQNKIQSTQNELCGVTIGDSVMNVLPQELLSLIHPALKVDFYRRFSERQLLQFELKRKEQLGKGNIVVLLDDSGSMNWNDRREYARGAIFGLAEIAKNDGRNIAVNIFSSRGQEWKREYLKGKMTIAETMELMQTGFQGGTYFDSPVLWGLEKVREQNYTDADIVIITDGECDLRSETLKQVLKLKEELNTSIHAITLDSEPEHMKSWCDHIFKNLDAGTLEDLMDKI